MKTESAQLERGLGIMELSALWRMAELNIAHLTEPYKKTFIHLDSKLLIRTKNWADFFMMQNKNMSKLGNEPNVKNKYRMMFSLLPHKTLLAKENRK